MEKCEYKVGIIGTGMIANAAHIPALNNLRKKKIAEIVAVADVNSESAKRTAERHGIKEYYSDPQKMLDEKELDIVVICTPNYYHKQWTIAALRSGANVVCEKPLTIRYKDSIELFEEAKKCGRNLYPVQSIRWRNDIEHSYKIIQSGEIGATYYSDISYIRRYGIPMWGMYHMKEYNVGGAFCDVGVHFLDAFLWMAGNPEVESVSGNAFTKLAVKGEKILVDIAEGGAYSGLFNPVKYDYKKFNVEEFAVGSIRFKGDIFVNFKFAWAVFLPTSGLEMSVIGDKGGFIINKNTLIKNINGYQGEIVLNTYDNRAYRGIEFARHWYMWEHLIKVMEGQEERRVKPEETLNLITALECFYRSAEEHREVSASEIRG